MLMQLEIKNFAIIDHTIINFENGFNVLTGETGAGKSILLDSLSAVLGGRISKDVVRKEKDKSYIKAVFKKTPKLKEQLIKMNLNTEDDVVVIEKQINVNGRSLSKINNSIQTIQIVKELSSFLIEICGQRDHQDLLKENYYLFLLDKLSGEEHVENVKQYQEKFLKYKKIEEKINSLKEGKREQEQLLDLYKFQKKEIEEANLNEEEESLNEEELKTLQSFEKVSNLISEANNALSNIDYLYNGVKALESAGEYNQKFKELFERMEKAYYEIEDISSEVGNLKDDMFYDEERLNELIARKEVYKHMKRKYGDTIFEINELLKEITQKVDEVENKDEVLERLSGEKKEILKEMSLLANDISKKRKDTSKIQTQKINKEIHELCMPEANIEFFFSENENYNHYGFDKVILLFSANKGEDPKLISKVASGGELSRILLAIKIATKVDQEKVYFFDEVDEGVGGEAGRVIGEKLLSLGSSAQIMAISHLPQVAAKGNIHFHIKKANDGERTFSKVHKLNEKERQQEIARMIYGENADDVTFKQAKKMLEK